MRVRTDNFGVARPLLRWGALLVSAVLLAAGCSLIGDDGPDPQPTVDAFAAAWSAGDQAGMVALTADGGREVDLAIRQFQGVLGVTATEVEAGAAENVDDGATAPLTVTQTLAGLGPWTYDTELPLVRSGDDWAVAWSSEILHPKLTPGHRVARQREVATRGPILAQAGQSLAEGNPPARSPEVAVQTVGTTAMIDRARAEELGPTYEAGDWAGESGVEAAFEHRLAGTPSGAVQLVDATGAVVEDLTRFEGEAGRSVTTTLDFGLQQSADAAVAGSAQPTALVVLESATGAVRAVANNPPGFDRAFLGEYPPGSTFKIVTSTAMLADGVAPDAQLRCPPETRPGDSRPFTNADPHAEDITFQAAFAESCNTTFVDEGYRLGGEAIQEQAEVYGFNSGFNPGIPAVVGKYPPPETDTELAASAIGQGRVTASPLHMASVAAAARTGSWNAPYLVKPESQLRRPLAEDAAPALTAMMREVVQNELGTAPVADVDGYDVGGKTGTAEFGIEEPPETHAWFVGFVDDLSFAVVVEAGGVGGSVAAPIARTFVESLPVAGGGAG